MQGSSCGDGHGSTGATVLLGPGLNGVDHHPSHSQPERYLSTNTQTTHKTHMLSPYAYVASVASHAHAYMGTHICVSFGRLRAVVQSKAI